MPRPSSDPTSDAVDDAVAETLALVDAATPRLGGAHLLCLDGPSGSGKSTLAAQVVRRRPDTTMIPLDALLDGWDGLPGVAATLVHDVLEPLSRQRPASWRRYDWITGRFAGRVPITLHPDGLLLVEGVGAGDLLTAPYRSALVWVDAPVTTRRARALARPEDGEVFADHWDSWARQESAHHAVQATRRNADLVVRTG